MKVTKTTTTTRSLQPGIAMLALALLATPMLASGADEKPSQKIEPYPLKTCLVSGEKLGSMGEPHVINHKGQEIKFCCKGCVKDFNKEPEKYLKKMTAGEQKQDAHSDHTHP